MRGGDLTQLEAGYGPAGVVAALGGIYGSLDTDNVAGLTLPRNISADDSWSQSMDLSGQVHLPNDTLGYAEGVYSASYTAIGMENITMPAGTYNAMRIQVNMLYDVVVTVEEIDVPWPFPVNLTLWYAPGVGLVKAENLNEIIEHENIELLRYFIP